MKVFLKKKGLIIVLIFIVAVTSLLLLNNGKTNNQTKLFAQSESEKQNYKLKQIFENKTKYLGDNSKVSTIIKSLPYSEYNSEGIEIKTSNTPYELIVKYKLIEQYNLNVILKNSFILFWSVDNLDVITYDFGNNKKVQFTREEILKVDNINEYNQDGFIAYINSELDIKIDKYIQSFYDNNIVKLYVSLISNIMEEDKALNYEMKYLAINTESFIKQNNGKLSVLEINAIIYNIEKKYENIIQASMQDLKDKGLFDEQKIGIDGVYVALRELPEEFKEEKNNVKDNEALLTIWKYKSGDGSITVTYKCTLENNLWKIKSLGGSVS